MDDSKIYSVEEIKNKTAGKLFIPDEVPEMKI